MPKRDVSSYIVVLLLCASLCILALMFAREIESGRKNMRLLSLEQKKTSRHVQLAEVRQKRLNNARKLLSKYKSTLSSYKIQYRQLESELLLAETDATYAREMVAMLTKDIVRLNKERLNRRIETIDELLNRAENEPEKRHNNMPRR